MNEHLQELNRNTLAKFLQLSKHTLIEQLGIVFTEASKEKVVARMPVDTRTRQPMGLLHGGASVALAETVASMGGVLHLNEGFQAVVGQEINANHLRSISAGEVEAVAMPVHIGKRSQVWEVKIYNVTTQELTCISRCTLAVRSWPQVA